MIKIPYLSVNLFSSVTCNNFVSCKYFAIIYTGKLAAHTIYPHGFTLNQVKQCLPYKCYSPQLALGISSNCKAHCSPKHAKCDINSIFSQRTFCRQLISARCLFTTQLSLNTNEIHLPLPAQSYSVPTRRAVINASLPMLCL